MRNSYLSSDTAQKRHDYYSKIVGVNNNPLLNCAMPLSKVIAVTIIFFFVILLLSCQDTHTPAPDNKKKVNESTISSTPPHTSLENVSIVDLMSAPAKYDGKWIGVTGVLSVEPENNTLYLHKDDYVFAISENAVWLELKYPVKQEWEKLQSKYVFVIGIFNANQHGHLGVFRGSITNIQEITLRNSREHR